MRKFLATFCISCIATIAMAQNAVTVSGTIRDSKSKSNLPYVSVAINRLSDSAFVAGTITNEKGLFSIPNVAAGNYVLQISYTGYTLKKQQLLVGKLSAFLDVNFIDLEQQPAKLNDVTVTTTQQAEVSDKLDKKTFSISNNISQSGGSVLQAMRNLPGITVGDDGKVELRGSEKISVLIDGKQTALTGFGNQAGLDNIPASAIERIEIINNPSAKFDANGNAGIINIIYKKSRQQGFNGKLGITTGLGALWIKQQNYPGIRAQYQGTPKFNPSLSLNYRKNKINAFVQADYLYNKTLNKNDFTTRYYSSGDTLLNQVKRNRITTVGTGKAGIDWQLNDNNSFTIFGLYSSEYVRDNGDIPYYNAKLTQRRRLWQFYEDEVNSSATFSSSYQHKFAQPGHLLNVSFNYTFHREDEKYFLTDNRPTYTGRDTFKLIADEHVTDINVDYVKPLKQGRFEGGVKFRRRTIPTNMRFFPGLNSPLDVNAGGQATYKETIPALYGNYVYENKKVEIEAGVRLEYVDLKYNVNPGHNTYKSDGYNYTQPFPSIRVGYKINDRNKISLFYNRRVDRPDEGDIRIFPKYDDPEILKVGNPTLRPQFTNTLEAGYRKQMVKGYLYSAIYFRTTQGTITRIGTLVPNSSIIYSIFQNAGRSYNTGVEMLLQQDISKVISFNTNINIYRNQIDGFTVINRYPTPTAFSDDNRTFTSGNAKVNGIFHFANQFDVQLTAIYQAPDIIPQGKVYSRFSVDAGLKKSLQKGKAELFANGSDLFNTLRTKKEISGSGFRFLSTDYYETQAFRIGFNYKF